MTRRATLGLLAILLAAGALVLAGVGALGRAFPAGESVPGAPALAERLAGLGEDVRVTWIASPPERWEGEFRHLEPALRGFLATLEARGQGRVRCARLDAGDPELAQYAARLGLAPFRARVVERDGWRETSLWSSLRIVVGARGAAVVDGLTPDKLPWLAELVDAEVDQILEPRRPRILLEAEGEHPLLERELGRWGEVVRGELERTGRFVEEADLVVWLEPRSAGPAQLAALRAWLERGRSVVIAGSAWRARAQAETLALEPAGPALESLLAEFGLQAERGPLLEDADPAQPGNALPLELVRSIGEDQDFRRLRGQPNGTLLFAAPTSFRAEPERLAELGLEFRVLASSSARSFVLPGANAALARAELAALPTRADRPGAPLAALLEPLDPWRGRVVLLAAGTPFAEPHLGDAALAHRALLEVLVRTLASDERLAFARVAAARPAPLAPLAAGERTRLRLWVVAALPLALLLLGAFLRTRAAPLRASGARRLALVGLLALAGLALLALARGAIPGSSGVDLTREQAHELPPALVERLAEAASAGPLRARLVFSVDERLPPEFRPGLRALRALLDGLAARAPLELEELRLHALGDEERASLAALGLAPLRVSSRREESVLVREIAAQLVLEQGARLERLAFPEPGAFDDLAFRLAFAFERLQSGRPVRVAVACEPPRLSPAERRLEYEARQLFAPGGGDVYARARALLAQHDFEVQSLPPGEPGAGAQAELFVWLQPRRDIGPRFAALAERLGNGGKALVAAQHFVGRARGGGEGRREPGWWPEPQFCDLETSALAGAGLELVREVLFDEQCTTGELEERAARAPGEAHLARVESALPLFVRVGAAGLNAEDPLTRGLAGLVLPFPSRIRCDATRLAAHGLVAHALVHSSPRTWELDWKGGDLPAASLSAEGQELLGPQPLALRVRGRFGAGTAPGELVLVGCSEMFQDAWIERAGADNGRLLVNAVAALTLPPRVAELLERRALAPGLDWIEPARRARLRLATLGAAPLLLCACAGLWFLVRRPRRGENSP